MNEFELIARFFDRPTLPGSGVARGVGDDCALLDFGGPTQLAVTTDMLIAGRHFRADADPRAVGHKALAVNLSDLAAAGAQPRCFFLAVALPEADASWLQAFTDGMFALADANGCSLAGGDTTRAAGSTTGGGPLTISITAIGEVPRGAGLTRGGASPGDDIWVSGELGDAALCVLLDEGAVTLPETDAQRARSRLDWPAPRVELGIALRGLATACIDVSDGLIGDLGHILERSGVGATVGWAAIPRGEALRAQPTTSQIRCALAGGDDYELLFSARPGHRPAVEAAAKKARTSVTRVGAITEGRDLVVLDAVGKPMDMPFKAYDHFGSHERTS
jgi:thiamine-monophosphate kinase